MRVVYFCTSGEMSLVPLQTLIVSAHLLAVVRPASAHTPGRQLLGHLAQRVGLRSPDPIERLARAHKVPVLRASSGHDAQLLTRLRALQPELICIATFRWLLAPDIFLLPTHGTINLHPSLLPRHRGPVPLFWIYYHNDWETGVTIHQVTQQADAGAILAQECFSVPRGLSVECLNRMNARQGATLLAQAVNAIARGDDIGWQQDDTLATYAPRVKPGHSMVQYATWEVERVWHFLAGLWPRFREPLVTAEGESVRYSQVLGYRTAPHDYAPGSVQVRPYGVDLFCLDGWVQLAVPVAAYE